MEQTAQVNAGQGSWLEVGGEVGQAVVVPEVPRAIEVGDPVPAVPKAPRVNALGLESAEGFLGVSREWVEKGCVPLPEVVSSVQRQAERKRDKLVSLKSVQVSEVPGFGGDDDLRAAAAEGVLGGLRAVPSGPVPEGGVQRWWELTEEALTQWGSRVGAGSAAVGYHCRQGEWDLAAETHRRAQGRTVARKRNEKLLFRVLLPEEGAGAEVKPLCRAVLSDVYRPFDTSDLLEVVAEALGREVGGEAPLVSHWEFSPTEGVCYGHVLIPDSMSFEAPELVESDSAYFGLLTLSNNEVGRGCVRVSAGVYRAICRNGCIHGFDEKAAVARRHVGRKRSEVAAAVRRAIAEGVPLIPQVLERVRGLQEYPVPAPRAAIAALTLDSRQSQAVAQSWARGYWEEVRARPGLGNTAAGVYHGLTRAARDAEGGAREELESFSSGLIYTPGRKGPGEWWQGLVTRASTLGEEEVKQQVKVWRPL